MTDKHIKRKSDIYKYLDNMMELQCECGSYFNYQCEYHQIYNRIIKLLDELTIVVE